MAFWQYGILTAVLVNREVFDDVTVRDSALRSYKFGANEWVQEVWVGSRSAHSPTVCRAAYINDLMFEVIAEVWPRIPFTTPF